MIKKRLIWAVVLASIALISASVVLTSSSRLRAALKSATQGQTTGDHYLVFEYPLVLPIEWQATFSKAHAAITIDVVDKKNRVIKKACSHPSTGVKVRGMKCEWDGTMDNEEKQAPSGYYKFRASVGEPPREAGESQLFFLQERPVEEDNT